MIPKELKKTKNWMLSHNKIPCDINGISSSRNKKDNWKYYDEIEPYLNKYGTSFCLDNNYVICDLDNCIDKNGVLKKWAVPFISGNVYIEYSSSKKGLHIIYRMCNYFFNKKGINVKINNYSKDGIEIYSNKRNFVLTGDIYKNYNTINDNANCLIPVYKSVIESFDNDLFNDIKKAISIKDIINYYNISIKRNIILCPFHSEKTPSLVIYENTNSWYCWGCKSGGTIIDFVMKKENLDKLNSAKWINDKFNLNLEKEINLKIKSEIKTFSDCYTEKGKVIHDKFAMRFFDYNPLFYMEDDFYLYNNGVYKKETPERLEYKIKKCLSSNNISTRNLSEIKNLLIRSSANITYSQLNNKKNIINLKDCILTINYDKYNYSIIDHSPKYKLINQFNVNFNVISETKYWNKFIDNALDKDSQLLLQEIMGYLLIPETRPKKLFIFQGPPDCGKSTILSIICKILSESNVSAIDPKYLQPEYKFYHSQLFGKLANICGDISNQTLDPALLKQLLGEDKITADRKNKNPIEFTNFARCVFSCNEIPMTKDKTDAWFNKVIFLKFRKPNYYDKDLKKNLDKELDGIFKWALDGLLRLLKNDLIFTVSDSSKKTMKEYKELNNPAMKFVEDVLEFEENGYIKSSELYNKYKLYSNSNGIKPLSSIKFFKFLKNNYGLEKKVLKKNGNSINGIQGINWYYDKMERNAIRSESNILDLFDDY